MQERTCAPLTRFDRSTIDCSSPWEGNLVPDREDMAKTLTRHFSASGGPYVVSVSSPWGTGKSDFLERWEKWLHSASEEKKPQLCFRFNAWEHDYTQDPFLAFATAFSEFIKNNPTSFLDSLKDDVDAVLQVFLASVGKLVSFGTRIAAEAASCYFATSGDLPSAGMAKEATKSIGKEAQKLLEWASVTKESRKDFIEGIKTFGEVVLKNYETPLIVMVDELDRCKPSFAVALLETIKHLFCVQGVVFVLAIEAKQLGCVDIQFKLS